jgi:hypothetical protein
MDLIATKSSLDGGEEEFFRTIDWWKKIGECTESRIGKENTTPGTPLLKNLMSD